MSRHAAMPLRPILLAAGLIALALPAQAQAAGEAPCVDGLASLPGAGSFPCSGVALAGHLPRSAFSVGASGESDHNDVWGWTDPVTGTEYALVGTANGTGFVDLSVPTRPRLVGKLPTATTPIPWRDVKVYRDHAFIVSEARNHGVQVFDLTRLRGLTGPPTTFTADARYTGLGSAHNVVINEETGFAYAVGSAPGPEMPAACGARGFHAINIQDPQNPTFAGCFSDAAQDAASRYPGYTHDAQCVVYRGPDADYTGREVCFGANEDVVTAFDVTDKQDVLLISQAAYPRSAYTHQGWLTEDHRYLLTNDELDERNGLVPSQRTVVLDYQDLDNPEIAMVYDSGLSTIDHNLYVRGRYAFESNYESGLRVLDVSGVAGGALSEVAFFDTYPTSTAATFNGQWSNYPYFESGLVVANDISNGLFVLRPDAAFTTGAQDGPPAPASYALSDPSPNPTASGARLALRVDEAQQVRADLYDVAGRRVATVFSGTVGPGAGVRLDVPGAGLPAGVYLVRVRGEHFEASRQLVLTR